MMVETPQYWNFLGVGNTKGLEEHSRQIDKTIKTPKTTLESLCTLSLKNLLTNTEVTEFAVHMLCKDIFREADDINSHNGSIVSLFHWKPTPTIKDTICRFILNANQLF